MIFKTAWREAEQTVFDLLCKHFKSSPNKNAFRGFLPPVDGAWALISGGAGSATEESRFGAEGQIYSTMALAARLEHVSLSRDAGLDWAMDALDFFRKEGNCKNIHNVTWFHAIASPDEPLYYPVNDQVAMFLVTVKCKLLFRTDAVLS